MTPVCLPNRDRLMTRLHEAGPVTATLTIVGLIFVSPVIAMFWIALQLYLLELRIRDYVEGYAGPKLRATYQALALRVVDWATAPVAGNQGSLQSAVSRLSVEPQVASAALPEIHNGRVHLPAQGLPQAHNATMPPQKLPLQRQARCKKFPTGTTHTRDFVRRAPHAGHRQNTTN